MRNPEHFGFPANLDFNTTDDLKLLINKDIKMNKELSLMFPNDSKYLELENVDKLFLDTIEKNHSDNINQILITRF